MIKAFVTDMDGTFLSDDKSYDESFYVTLQDLRNSNIKFIVASGNQYDKLEYFFRKDFNDIWFIAENGANIVYNGATIKSYKIVNQDAIKGLISYAKEHMDDTLFVACGKKCAYALSNYSTPLMAELNRYYGNRKYIYDLDELLHIDDDLLKITFCRIGKSIELGEDIKKFSSVLKVTVSGNDWVDTMSLGVNKGAALKFVLDHLNIDPSQIIAFGDQSNDIEMLELAGTSYAVANATDEVKRIVTNQCSSNNDGGVIKTIRSLIK